jgi:hypothetical protein
MRRLLVVSLEYDHFHYPLPEIFGKLPRSSTSYSVTSQMKESGFPYEKEKRLWGENWAIFPSCVCRVHAMDIDNNEDPRKLVL